MIFILEGCLTLLYVWGVTILDYVTVFIYHYVMRNHVMKYNEGELAHHARFVAVIFWIEIVVICVRITF